MLSASDVAGRLAEAYLDGFGLRPEDLADIIEHAARARRDDRDRVAEAAGRLEARIGDLDFPGRACSRTARRAWAADGSAADPRPGRVRGRRTPLPRRPRVPPDVPAGGLRDLGQQLSVHRRTYGGFGLHTQRWLVCVWSGAYFWLGRLAFNLKRLAAGG